MGTKVRLTDACRVKVKLSDCKGLNWIRGLALHAVLATDMWKYLLDRSQQHNNIMLRFPCMMSKGEICISK